MGENDAGDLINSVELCSLKEPVLSVVVKVLFQDLFVSDLNLVIIDKNYTVLFS